MDTFEVLVGRKARIWLCYVIRKKIIGSSSNFVYVNEKFCNENLSSHVQYGVGKFSQILYCLYNTYRGSSLELNALRESWRCRKCQKLGYCMFGSFKV